jgi:hypothetical protein
MWAVWAALLMCPLLVASCVGWSRHDGDFEKAPPEIKQDWTLVKQRCSGCHDVDRVFNKMAAGVVSNRGDIEFMVVDMQSRPGANIPDAEVDRIINVLDWHLNR